jgi:hypothetical protein
MHTWGLHSYYVSHYSFLLQILFQSYRCDHWAFIPITFLMTVPAATPIPSIPKLQTRPPHHTPHSAGANLEVDVPWKWLNFFLEDDARLAQVRDGTAACACRQRSGAVGFPRQRGRAASQQGGLRRVTSRPASRRSFSPASPGSPPGSPSERCSHALARPPAPLLPRLATRMAAGAC